MIVLNVVGETEIRPDIHIPGSNAHRVFLVKLISWGEGKFDFNIWIFLHKPQIDFFNCLVCRRVIPGVNAQHRFCLSKRRQSECTHEQ